MSVGASISTTCRKEGSSPLRFRCEIRSTRTAVSSWFPSAQASIVQPLIILVAVPLATTGVLGALLLTAQSLNLTSGLGVPVLLGTVVKTSIILFANYRRRAYAGAHSSFAVYTGTSERLRPILISTLATIAGLLPIAVNFNGLSTEDGIAIAIIGGLIVSTALTLFVVPLITWRYYQTRGR